MDRIVYRLLCFQTYFRKNALLVLITLFDIIILYLYLLIGGIFKMRLFIAVTFPSEFRSSVLQAEALLKSQCISGRFTQPEYLHLTLAFIGEFQNLSLLRNALSSVSFPVFSVSTKQIGHFGDLWWLGLHPCPELQKLAKDLRAALENYKIPFDKKPFRPHITLARQVTLEHEPAIEVPTSTLLVEKISVMSSERYQGRLKYRELFSFPAKP